MKNTVKTLCIAVLIPFLMKGQVVDNLQSIAPFEDGIAAVQSEGKWGFINKKGDLIVDFRNDIAITKKAKYPEFSNDRCLIIKEKKDIKYYGYINSKGETVIEPKFLNATNFKNNKAIALELVEEVLGKNDPLGKRVVSYSYFEVVIDTDGKVLEYLTDSKHINLSKKYLIKPPKITSKFISDNLVAILKKDNSWSIKKLD